MLDFLVLLNPGAERAEPQSDLECGRGFFAENLEYLVLGERLWRSRPAELGSLAAA